MVFPTPAADTLRGENMSFLSELRLLTVQQRKTVLASYLGWTLDAFDFFILVFVIKDVAAEFTTDIKAVTYAITLTLMVRPLGALIFGLAAERFGRRPTLMVDVILYSILEFASGFAPSLTVFIALRVLYGIAMGGEWGVGASLAMETIPPRARGVVSGILQAGYPSGYLIASVVFGLLFEHIGWRGMFMIGALPALLVLYIRRHVEESPTFLAREKGKRGSGIVDAIRRNALLFLYAVLLMTAFNFFSHGTQDLYPTFLREQRGFDAHTVGLIAVIYNIGAIVGGLTCGHLSEIYGRRRVMIVAALCALPVIPLWALTSSPWLLGIGAFLMQFAVQGAWGIVPVHLNELSPDEVRSTFPGFAYQLGNLLASANATLQAEIAQARGGNYAFALSITVAVVALFLAGLAAVGIEKRGVAFGGDRPPESR
jgi:SHS family lactate transporter-like MFS transporter